MRLPANFPPLCEILDAANHPICLADYNEVKSQGLRHRAFAALLWHPPFYLLRRNADGFGFFCHSFLPPNLTPQEASANSIAECFGEEGAASIVMGSLSPCPETGNGLIDFCLSRISRRLALDLDNDPREWLSATRDELFALREDGLYEPLLLHILSCGWFK